MTVSQVSVAVVAAAAEEEEGDEHQMNLLLQRLWRCLLTLVDEWGKMLEERFSFSGCAEPDESIASS